MQAIQKGDYLTSLDLSEAYLHIPIRCTYRCYLWFAYNEEHYQYQVLPFGLKSSPRVFTKVLVALVAHLWVEGIPIFPYLDDLLLRAPSFQLAQEAVDRTIQCLAKHGFVTNVEKSTLVPTQVITHLEVTINTLQDRVVILMDRLQKLQALLHPVLEAEATQLMILIQLLGMMVSCQDVLNWSHFHVRPLKQFLLPFQ